ncbi:MAG: hypothetical protein IJK64_11545 [Clostridia bacterium]|nr:hypothetical protein [Clostridia bacterium]
MFFNAKTYNVFFRQANAEQWEKGLPISETFFQHDLAAYRGQDEEEAIEMCLQTLKMFLPYTFKYDPNFEDLGMLPAASAEYNLMERNIKFYDEDGNFVGIFFDFKAEQV